MNHCEDFGEGRMLKIALFQRVRQEQKEARAISKEAGSTDNTACCAA